MPDFARVSKATFCFCVVLQFFWGTTLASAQASAQVPTRVVSMNLCTDQLAMLLAKPVQLISVSNLARDPRSSAMALAAQAYPVNGGGAEQVFLLKPDLVLAGSFTTRATVTMLRKLGIRVVQFQPAYSLDDVKARIIQMGDLLGQQARAIALSDDFDRRLQALRKDNRNVLRAALYFANGYTSGDKTLAGQILAAAGFYNIARDAGLPDGGILPLEVLVTSRPDLVITGTRYAGASRAESILEHPALRALPTGQRQPTIADSDWVCGTPFVLRAIEDLVQAGTGAEGTQ
jgi:iron complex transport system substrate-binding protein